MNTALKNRLVGTVIIVALAVIFLPEYLDGKKRVREDIQVVIPPMPEVDLQRTKEILTSTHIIEKSTYKPAIENDTALDSDNPNEPTKDLASAGDNPLRTVSNIENDNETEPDLQVDTTKVSRLSTSPQDYVEVDESLAQQTLLTKQNQDDTGWVIQLGSFKHQKNVRELVRKVEKAGYRTFTRPIQTPAGKLTKVFVGPEINKSKLDGALPHLKEVTGLAGRITPFEIK